MTPRQRLLSQHNLVYETAPTVWQEGFPLGNGHFGALVYQPQGLEFALTKLDVWDRRQNYPPKIPFDRIRRLADSNPQKMLLELATESPTPQTLHPGPKPCGKLTIAIDDWSIAPLPTIFSQTQQLSLYDATLTAQYEISTKAMRFDAFVHPDENLLVINAADTFLDKRIFWRTEQRITLSRDLDHALGLPKTGCDGNLAWIEYQFPDGFAYVIALLIDGADLAAPEIYPNSIDLIAKLDYTGKKLCSYRIYLTAVTSLDSADPLAAARQNLKSAAQRGFKKLKTRHDQWWARFWDQSAVELENKFLESLWYFSLYQFASSSRGKTAPGLFGLWNASKVVPWSGDYHGDINMAMTYWPIFSSNHLELGEPFFETFDKLARIGKKQTQELYQIDGLKFPIATLDTGDELCTGFYRLIQCSTAFYALIYWNWYLYTQDPKILKEHIFFILEEGSKFYLALTRQQGDTLLIGPSWAPEQGPCPAYNTNNDLGLIKPLWQAYVAACEILNVQSDTLDRVNHCLEHFPPYPAKNGEFLDSLTAGVFIGLNHPGLLAMVVPGQDIDADHPLAPTAKKTMHNYLRRTNRKSFSDRLSSACDLAWPWLIALAVKLRDPDFAEHILMDIGIAEYLKSNGMFGYLGGGLLRSTKQKRKAYATTVPEISLHALTGLSSTRKGRELMMSMLQQASAYIYAVNEMLLQSHHGILRIFPSVPACLGDCAFDNLRAEGAFLVSARAKNHKTTQVIIQSLAGKDCILTIYDIPDTKTLKLKNSDNQLITTHHRARHTWQFKTKKGQTYYWSRGGRQKPLTLKTADAPPIKLIKDLRGNLVSYGKKGHLFDQP